MRAAATGGEQAGVLVPPQGPRRHLELGGEVGDRVLGRGRILLRVCAHSASLVTVNVNVNLEGWWRSSCLPSTRPFARSCAPSPRRRSHRLPRNGTASTCFRSRSSARWATWVSSACPFPKRSAAAGTSRACAWPSRRSAASTSRWGSPSRQALGWVSIRSQRSAVRSRSHAGCPTCCPAVPSPPSV